MGLTRPRDLALAAVLAGVVGYLFIRLVYRDFPPIRVWTGLSLLVIAGAEAAWAVTVRRRIRDGQIGVGSGRLDPLAVARSVAIAKASAWAGALAAGWWVAVLAYLLPRRGELRVAASDTPGAVVAAGCALLLVIAALWLQHACRSPQDPAGQAGEPPE